jgi:hypothetical protein
MSRGMPSMAALLGLLALAGYQNRDKLAELVKGSSNSNSLPGARATNRVVAGGTFGASVARASWDR